MKYFLLFSLILLVFTFSGCTVQANSEAQPMAAAPVPEIVQTQTAPEEPQPLDDYFVKKDSLSFNGFEIVKLDKTVKLDYPPEMKSESDSVEVSYAVLKKKNKILKTFDGVYFGAGNATDFGLFPFLGKETKQLAVSQTIPRGGRHWIVDLSSEARVIFDSKDYGVGREEFSVIDLDKDGVFEILFPVTAFYRLENLNSMAEVPLPTAVFKYSETAKKYLPANRQFPDFLQNGISERIKNLRKNETGSLSERLKIVLSYIYAGKEKEAWDFFDNEYDSPDKAKIKTNVKSILKNEKIYQSISKTES